MSVSERTRHMVRCCKSSALIQGLYRAGANPYHPTENPDGIVNLGTAENHLMLDWLRTRVREIEAEDSMCLSLDELKYAPWLAGGRHFCDSVAHLLNEQLGTEASDWKLKEGHLRVMNGVGTVINILGTVLCDDGDAAMIPAPYYGGFKFGLNTRSNVDVVPIPCLAPTFRLSVAQCDRVYQESLAKGVNVKVMILCNPGNPTGEIYPAEFIQECLAWAKQHAIHVIFDEIYAMSVLDASLLPSRDGALTGEFTVESDRCSAPFASVLSLSHLPDPERTHLVWGFSKDFCLGGFRVGLLASRNPAVLEAVDQISMLTAVSSRSQRLITRMILSEDGWTDRYLRENQRRLAIAYTAWCHWANRFNAKLRAMWRSQYEPAAMEAPQIRWLRPRAGFFVWLSLQDFLPKGTLEEERAFWEHCIDQGVYFACGQGFQCPENGWFRIVYTAASRAILYEGLHRLGTLLEGVAMELHATSVHRGSHLRVHL